jgi:hypothetical protein
MGWLRDVLHWILALDRSITWDRRISRWANLTALVSVSVGVIVYVGAWLLDYPSFGFLALLVGLVVWVVLLNGLLALGRRAQPSTPSSQPGTTGASRRVYVARQEDVERLQEQLDNVAAERDELREEKHRDLQNQRRKRIEDWRLVIRTFDFSTGGFAGTDTYSQMKPYLQSDVVELLETPRTIHVGNEARGDLAYEYTLLDEVARIEKEWGLI